MKVSLRVGVAAVEDAASERSWSGTSFNMLKMLRATPGVDVILISPMGQRVKWLCVPRMLITKMLKKHFDWKREGWILRYFARVIKKRFYEENLDVILSPSSIPGTLLPAEIPVVFWTDASFHAMNGYYRENHSAHTLMATREQEDAAFRRARFACFATEWGAGDARKVAGSERVMVISFGPNLSIEHSQADVEQWIRERAQHMPKRCNLLLVGVDWKRKGVETAVKAAELMNEAGIATSLRIVGCAPPKERGPLPPFVDLAGFMSKLEPEGYKRIVEVYRTSDIFVLPSRAEAFGVVVAEAAAFGLPALVCRTGGLTETVRDGETGFALPLDDEGSLFAEHAQRILQDYERFAKNAYAEYANRMNWRTSVDRLVELLRIAAANRAPQG